MVIEATSLPPTLPFGPEPAPEARAQPRHTSPGGAATDDLTPWMPSPTHRSTTNATHRTPPTPTPAEARRCTTDAARHQSRAARTAPPPTPRRQSQPTRTRDHPRPASRRPAPRAARGQLDLPPPHQHPHQPQAWSHLIGAAAPLAEIGRRQPDPLVAGRLPGALPPPPAAGGPPPR